MDTYVRVLQHLKHLHNTAHQKRVTLTQQQLHLCQGYTHTDDRQICEQTAHKQVVGMAEQWNKDFDVLLKQASQCLDLRQNETALKECGSRLGIDISGFEAKYRDILI